MLIAANVLSKKVQDIFRVVRNVDDAKGELDSGTAFL